jgi:glycosyltransferase involved in cell wall biosynthesis
MRITAFMHAYNEGDIVYHSVKHLIENGIEVYFINHGSTDSTVKEASKWLGKGLIHIENFPQDAGYPEINRKKFVLTHLLRRIQVLSTRLTADWYLINDADEFRESPWPGLTLKEAFQIVDQKGYNAIHFLVFNFHPVDNSFIPGSDVRETLKYYEKELKKFNFFQIKAWKNLGKPVDLVTSGGHDIQFSGRKIFPTRFILRHYPIRSQAHGLKKIFTERKNRFTLYEKKKGMHVQYNEIKDVKTNFWGDPSKLVVWDEDAVRLNLLSLQAFQAATQVCGENTIQKLESQNLLPNFRNFLLRGEIQLENPGSESPLIEKLSNEMHGLILKWIDSFNPPARKESIALGDKALETRDFHKALTAYKKTFEISNAAPTFNSITSDHLKVSVIIPAFGELLPLHNCLKSIFQNTIFPNIEVILINSSSSKQVLEYLKEIQGTPIISLFQPVCQNPVQSWNVGSRAASGNYLFLLCPDFEVKEGWLDFFIEMVSSNSNFSALFPKVINSDGILLEAGFSFLNGNKIQGYGEGHPSDAPEYNHLCYIPGGSRFCAFIKKEEWNKTKGLDLKFSDSALALLDFHLSQIEANNPLIYCPSAEIKEQRSNSTSFHKKTSNPLRKPEIVKLYPFKNESRKKVLVVGVYLADQLNYVDNIIEILHHTQNWNLSQKWICLCGEPPNSKVAQATVKIQPVQIPKFTLINDILKNEDLSQYEYFLIIDDDILLPENFLDQFLFLQSKLDFAAAQPARTENSHGFFTIVSQQKGVLARQTLIIESGPVVSFHKKIYNFIYPFDLTSPMGWGYEYLWSYQVYKQGMKMGIIDNTPVDHSIREANEYYSVEKSHKQRFSLLKKHPHIPYEESSRVLQVFPLSEEVSS